jgi:hypothetical protein
MLILLLGYVIFAGLLLFMYFRVRNAQANQRIAAREVARYRALLEVAKRDKQVAVSQLQAAQTVANGIEFVGRQISWLIGYVTQDEIEAAPEQPELSGRRG